MLLYKLLYILSVWIVAAESDMELSVPSEPQNVSVIRVTYSMIKLGWGQPDKSNGLIEGYRLYFQHHNYTDIRTIRNPQPKMEYLLTDLEPYTNYTIWVRALSRKYEGDSSEQILVRTDVQGPSAPYIVNLTCQAADTFFLQWEEPPLFYHQIDYYYIYYRPENKWEYEEITVERSYDKLDHSILISNLTTNSLYEVKVRGGTRSLVDQTKIYRGQYSESRKVLLHSDVNRVKSVKQRECITSDMHEKLTALDFRFGRMEVDIAERWAKLEAILTRMDGRMDLLEDVAKGLSKVFLPRPPKRDKKMGVIVANKMPGIHEEALMLPTEQPEPVPGPATFEEPQTGPSKRQRLI